MPLARLAASFNQALNARLLQSSAWPSKSQKSWLQWASNSLKSAVLTSAAPVVALGSSKNQHSPLSNRSPQRLVAPSGSHLPGDPQPNNTSSINSKRKESAGRLTPWPRQELQTTKVVSQLMCPITLTGKLTLSMEAGTIPFPPQTEFILSTVLAPALTLKRT